MNLWEHTDWRVERGTPFGDEPIYRIKDSSGTTIARVLEEGGYSQFYRSAAELIAAAPEMLEALKAAHDSYSATVGEVPSWVHSARRAIAKATKA